MRRSIISLVVVALLAGGAYAFSTVAGMCGMGSGSSMQGGLASAAPDCEASEAPGNGASAPTSGSVAAHFDATMSGVCRFACATKVKYDAKDVVVQPGAVADKLTQCPVSGVVFAVEQSRPRVHLGDREYVTCCGMCAEKLKTNPRPFLASESPLRVQLLSFEGCPNVAAARASVLGVMASAGIDAAIEELDLSSPATPEALRRWGSPTILVNGKDVGGEDAPSGTACRIYRDEAGHMVGFPPASILRAALIAEPKPGH